MSGFFQALPFVIGAEGGFVDHPDDHGGATNQGITQATYDAWRQKHDLKPRSVGEITDSEVEAIYHRHYWVAARCDGLSWPLSLVHFDAAVNHGVGSAVRLLQLAVSTTPDGIWGPVTQAAVETQDALDAMNRYLWARLALYDRIVRGDRTQGVFLLGWLGRVLRLRKYALERA